MDLHAAFVALGGTSGCGGSPMIPPGIEVDVGLDSIDPQWGSTLVFAPGCIRVADVSDRRTTARAQRLMPTDGPEDVPIDPTPIAAAFAVNNLPPLQKAIAAHDRAAFDAAFADASQACNGCHQAANKAFIAVPATPGAAVPELDPVATAPTEAGGR